MFLSLYERHNKLQHLMNLYQKFLLIGHLESNKQNICLISENHNVKSVNKQQQLNSFMIKYETDCI